VSAGCVIDAPGFSSHLRLWRNDRRGWGDRLRRNGLPPWLQYSVYTFSNGPPNNGTKRWEEYSQARSKNYKRRFEAYNGEVKASNQSRLIIYIGDQSFNLAV
jgi:hypothetical protein